MQPIHLNVQQHGKLVRFRNFKQNLLSKIDNEEK